MKSYRIAIRYSGGEGQSVLLRISTRNALARGADIGYLSAFP